MDKLISFIVKRRILSPFSEKYLHTAVIATSKGSYFLPPNLWRKLR